MRSCGRIDVAVATALVVVAGCTSVVVKKDPGGHNKGFRYYRPKPYLFLGPGTTTATGEGTSKATTTKAVQIEVKYLPDYEEEYSVRLRPGVGKGKLELELEDGWNLTSVGLETDQQLDEIIASTADLVGAVGGIARPGAAAGAPEDLTRTTIYAASNVPYGYYEPVFSRTPHGRRIAAWRYVGFLPFGGGPVEAYDDGHVGPASMLPLYGLGVAEDGIPLFRPLPEMIDPGVGIPVQRRGPPPAAPGGGESSHGVLGIPEGEGSAAAGGGGPATGPGDAAPIPPTPPAPAPSPFAGPTRGADVPPPLPPR